MFDRLLYGLKLWFADRPFAFRAVFALGFFLAAHQLLTRHFEGEFTLTVGELGALVVGALSASLQPDEAPEPPQPGVPRPKSMSPWIFGTQKAGRYAVAALLITFAVLASDPIVSGDGSFGSKAHLTFLVLFTWPLGAGLPFWQPNRAPRPKREALPPLPPTLRLPPRPDRPV